MCERTQNKRTFLKFFEKFFILLGLMVSSDLLLYGQYSVQGPASVAPFKYSCWTARVYLPMSGCSLDSAVYDQHSLCRCEGCCPDQWPSSSFGTNHAPNCDSTDTLVVCRSRWVEVLVRPYYSGLCEGRACTGSRCFVGSNRDPLPIVGPSFQDTCYWICGKNSNVVAGLGGCSSFFSNGAYLYRPSCELPPGDYVQYVIDSATVPIPLHLRLVDLTARWSSTLPLTACVGDAKSFCVTIDSSSWMYVQAVHFYVGNVLVGTIRGAQPQYCFTYTFSSVGSYPVSVQVEWDPSKVICASCCSSFGPASGSSSCGECIMYTLRGVVQVSSCMCDLVAMPNAACAGEAIAFSVASANPLDTVIFSPGDGAMPFGVSLPGWTYTYGLSGMYTAAVIGVTSGGDTVYCETQVVVRPRPRVRIIGPTQMCWSGVGPQFCTQTLSMGPWLPGILYCVEEVVYGDSVSWQVSCGGRSGVQYVASGGTLTIMDWGSGRGGCQICATVVRNGCSSTSCVWVEDNRRGHGLTLRGPMVTCVDTVGAAIYSLDGLVPPGASVSWQVPSPATYAVLSPTSIVVNWDSLRGVGGSVRAILLGQAGCADTLSLTVYPCCGVGTPYVRQKVSNILRWNPNAFRCQTFSIHDTLWVDTSVTWVNCQVYLSPGAVIWVDKPRVNLTLETRPSCSAPGGTRLEPCSLGWRGIYLVHDNDQAVLMGYEDNQHIWHPVWIIGADTGIKAGIGSCTWQVDYGFFNQNGVALLKEGWNAQLCKVKHAYFTWARDSVALGTLASPVYSVDVVNRHREWRSALDTFSWGPSRGVVGIWLRKPFAREAFRWKDQNKELYFRYLHYGIVGQNVGLGLVGGAFEQIRTPIPPVFPCVVGEDFPLPKVQDRCMAPVECPWGTGVCAQGPGFSERGFRDTLQVQQTRMDTVDYGIYVTSLPKGLDTSLRAIRLHENRLGMGFVGITLWNVGLSGAPFAVEAAIQRNWIMQQSETGIRLQVGKVKGIIGANDVRLSGRYGQAGIWVGGRISHDPRRDIFTIGRNTVAGYRWGIRWIEAAGPALLVDNTLRVGRPCGGAAISVEPFGISPITIGWNYITQAPGLYPLCSSSTPCSTQVRAGVEVEIGTVSTPVDVVGNQVHLSGLSEVHAFRFSSSLSVASVRWYCNETFLQDTLTAFDLFISGSSYTVGSPTQPYGRNRFLPFTRGRRFFPDQQGSLIVYRDGGMISRNIPPSCNPPSFLNAACRNRPSTCLCPPRAVLGWVLRQGIDTVVLVEAVGRGGSVARLWPAYRALRLDTTGQLVAADSVLLQLWQWGRMQALDPIEAAYEVWHARRTSVGVLPTGTSMAELTGAIALPLIEKAMSRQELTSVEAESLVTIAKRCPEVGGPLVHAARLAVEAYGLSLFYGGGCEEAEVEGGLRWRPSLSSRPALEQEEAAPTLPYLRVFPNPADLTVTIEWGGGVEKGEVLIVEAMGRVRERWPVGSEGMHRLLVADWPRGLYKVLYQTAGEIRVETLLLK